MRKRWRVSIILLTVVVLGGLAWALLRPHEPVYQRRPVSAWLNDCAEHELTPSLMALHAIGTNGLPYAIRRIEQDNSLWQAQYKKLWPKLPPALRRVLPAPRSPLVDAVNVFVVVGPSAFPQAMKALHHKLDVLREDAVSSLRFFRMSPEQLAEAVPALAAALHDPNPLVRLQAISTLAKLGPAAAPAVPALIVALDERVAVRVAFAPQGALGTDGSKLGLQIIPLINWDPRETAIDTLSKIGPAAGSAVPALKRLLQEQDSYLRGRVGIALWRITADADVSLPPLLQAMEEPSVIWANLDWIGVLGEMGPRAESAVPLLMRLAASRDKSAPNALSALKKIDPDAAERVMATSLPPGPVRGPKTSADNFDTLLREPWKTPDQSPVPAPPPH
jgi:HEAT repeats